MTRTIILALIAAAALAGCSDQSDTRKGPLGGDPNTAVEVGVVTLKAQTLPRFTELPGRVLANATAEIRPQVDGIVRKRLFQEGGPIKTGDPLYELNDAKFKAAVDAAQAAVQKADATVSGAQSTLDRNAGLAASKAISAQEVDTARTALLQAKADLAAANADLETAKINLGNTTIAAPISGIIGTSTVSVGSLVTANQTDALTTIREVDPALVELVDTSANLLRIREQVKAGTLGRPDQRPPAVTLTLENGQAYDSEGTMSLANMVVSETTATFSLRATFANPDRILMPGMFVRARVGLGVMKNAYLVPQRAVTRNAAGQATAYFVTADNKAEIRTLVTSGSENNDWIVISGLKDGDRLVVDGLQKVREGGTVKPLDVTIDDDGVIKQTIAPAGAEKKS